MRRMTPRRGGFTLVELLVVVAILAILAALATSAFIRARAGSERQATETTVAKLRSVLDVRWKAVLDDAKDDIAKGRLDAGKLADLRAFAANDPERTLAIYSYLKLKNEFPTTIAEACNPVYVPVASPLGSANFVGVRKVLEPKGTFTSGFKLPPRSYAAHGTVDPTNPDPLVEQNRTMVESAACLYWALSTGAARGQAMTGDGLPASDVSDHYLTYIQANGSPVNPPVKYTPRVYRDTFGQPIAFLRHGMSDELNEGQYTGQKKGTTVPANGPLRDPLDPRGTLVTFTNGWTQNHLSMFWMALYPKANETALKVFDADNTPTANSAFQSQHAVLPDGTTGAPKPFRDVVSAYRSDSLGKGPWNWSPTILSAGGDKTFADNLGQGDDILSFRLAREGNRGN